MEDPPDTTVVLVHWNQASVSPVDILASYATHRSVRRVLIVDNGSRPKELAALRRAVDAVPVDEKACRLTICELGRNTGFGPGANVGLQSWLAAPDPTPWALLAPYDAAPAPGCLDELVPTLAAEPMCGLGCADVGDGCAPVVDPYFGGLTRPSSVEEGWESVDYPHGTLMALRRDCVEEVGLFDPSYFAYCEEADLGIRARASGWSVGLVHGARVVNTHLGTSVPAVDYLMERNTLRLVRAHFGRYHAFIRLCITGLHLWSGWRHPERRPEIYSAAARRLAIVDALRGRSGPPPPALYDRD